MVIIDDELAEMLRDVLPRIGTALEAVERVEPQTAGLTIAEAAHELRLSVRSVESMVADGTLVAARFGRRVVIPRTEIERILAASIARPVRRAG